MSTRACIARRDGDSSWTGSYVHSDGYPDVTGRVLVEMVRDMGAEAVLAYAATAPQGWTHFPDQPSVYHDEPLIMTPHQDGGAEWLYLITDDFEIKVYRSDPNRRRFARVGTIDPGQPEAVQDMAALAHAASADDAIPTMLEAEPPADAVAPNPEPLRSWQQRVRDMQERTAILAPLLPDRPAAVSMPDTGVRLTLQELVASMVYPRSDRPQIARGEAPGTRRDRVSRGGEA